MTALSADAKVRPLAAGSPILVEPPGANEVATLGLTIDAGALGRFGLTCFHVLFGDPRTAVALDHLPVYQPGVAVPANIVGVTQGQRVAPALDCAAFRIADVVSITHSVHTLGECLRVTEPQPAMAVVKFGYKTGVTRGEVFGEDRAWNEFYVRSTEASGVLTSRGDSGAVWFAEGTMDAVLLNTGSSFVHAVPVAVCYPIWLVLQALRLPETLGPQAVVPANT